MTNAQHTIIAYEVLKYMGYDEAADALLDTLTDEELLEVLNA